MVFCNLFKHLIRLIFVSLVVFNSFLSLKDTNTQVKALFKNINYIQILINAIFKTNLKFDILYRFGPNIISSIYFFYLAASILLLFRSKTYISFVLFGLGIQLILVYNFLTDRSTKCLIMASTYIGITAGFFYLDKD